MAIHVAKNAAKENIDRFIDGNKDPVMFNVNVALFNIAEGIETVLSRLDDIERRVRRLEK